MTVAHVHRIIFKQIVPMVFRGGGVFQDLLPVTPCNSSPWSWPRPRLRRSPRCYHVIHLRPSCWEGVF